MKTGIYAGVLAMSASVLMVPASAQAAAETARASDPQGLVAILDAAGREPKLSKDDGGDPLIELDLDGYKGLLMFYGCDEQTHDKCESLQLQAGLDSEQPLAAETALSISRQYRFSSVHLDDEGDPWIKWDIITGKGIPSEVFLESVTSFSDVVSSAADIVFAEES